MGETKAPILSPDTDGVNKQRNQETYQQKAELDTIWTDTPITSDTVLDRRRHQDGEEHETRLQEHSELREAQGQVLAADAGAQEAQGPAGQERAQFQDQAGKGRHHRYPLTSALTLTSAEVLTCCEKQCVVTLSWTSLENPATGSGQWPLIRIAATLPVMQTLGHTVCSNRTLKS